MRERTCSTCGQTTWLAVDPPLDVVLDPEPLPTPMAELGAILTGATTYTVHRNGDVHHRHPLTIRTRPATPDPRWAVHADHRCIVVGSETMSR